MMTIIIIVTVQLAKRRNFEDYIESGGQEQLCSLTRSKSLTEWDGLKLRSKIHVQSVNYLQCNSLQNSRLKMQCRKVFLVK